MTRFAGLTQERSGSITVASKRDGTSCQNLRCSVRDPAGRSDGRAMFLRISSFCLGRWDQSGILPARTLVRLPQVAASDPGLTSTLQEERRLAWLGQPPSHCVAEHGGQRFGSSVLRRCWCRCLRPNRCEDLGETQSAVCPYLGRRAQSVVGVTCDEASTRIYWGSPDPSSPGLWFPSDGYFSSALHSCSRPLRCQSRRTGAGLASPQEQLISASAYSRSLSDTYDATQQM
jgi:hypothetical protein